MDHSFYQERLSAYLDRELPDDEMKAVEEHLAGCEECRRRLEQLKSLDDFSFRFSELDDSDYWEESARKIEARIEVGDEKIVDVKKARRGLYSGLWWKLPAVAASVLIVGYIGLHESEITDDGRLLAPQSEAMKVEGVPSDSSAAVDQLTEPRASNDDDLEPKPETSVLSEELAKEQVEHADRAEENVGSETKVGYEEGGVQHPEVSPSPPQPATKDKATTQLVAPAPAEPQAPRAEAPDLEVDSYKQPAPGETSGGEAEAVEPSEIIVDVPGDDYIPSQRKERSDESAESTTDEREHALGSVGVIKKDTTGDLDKVREVMKSLDEESGEPFLVMQNVVEGGELSIWQARRDSLQTLRETLAANTQDNSRPASKILSAAKGKRQSTSGASSLAPSQDTSAAILERINNELIEAWYRVCLVSKDEAEVARGRKFLEEAARDKHTESGRQARHFLELLDR